MTETEKQGRKLRGRPRSETTGKPPGTVAALERGLILLNALAGERHASLTDLSRITGVPASTAHRLLMTFQAFGYVDFNQSTNQWRIGVEAFRTGNAFTWQLNIVEAARDVMHGLVDSTGETANLAVPDGSEVVFVSQVETSNPIRAYFNPGTKSPMHVSGIGKAILSTFDQSRIERLLMQPGLPEFTANTLTNLDSLLSDLQETRSRGWSFDNEERNLGMRCIAAPIFNEYGEAVAGLSLSGPVARLPLDTVQAYGPLVREAAQRVTTAIGGLQAA
ncbi:MAG: IclR family transcriptional regulator [Alphaproteobacteria bacterium]